MCAYLKHAPQRTVADGVRATRTWVGGRDFVEMRLPLDVANTLRSVLDHIAGSPGSTYRGDTDAMRRALADAGIVIYSGRMKGTLVASVIQDGDE